MLKSKVIILFVVIFSLLAMSTISLAIENGTVYLESNQDVIEKGEEVEITVNLKDVTTAACNFFLYFDEDKWDYLSKMDNTNVEKNRILFVWYDTNGGRSAKQGELVKFRFKAKENGLSTFSIEGDFYNSVGQKLKVDFQEKQVQIGKEETIFQQQEEEEKGEVIEEEQEVQKQENVQQEQIQQEENIQQRENKIEEPEEIIVKWHK